VRRSVPTSERSSWWHFLCELLAEERRIYLGPHFSAGCEVSKEDFLGFWALRQRFAPPRSLSSSLSKSSMRVFVRVRPRMDVDESLAKESENATEQRITIPLHQRLELIKAARDDVTTSAQALKVLMSSRGVNVDEVDPWKSFEVQEKAGLLTAAPGDASKTTPPDETEDPFANDRFGCEVLGLQAGAQGAVNMLAPGVGLRTFRADHVFGPLDKQADVYGVCGAQVVRDALNGYNASLLCYGQTGSGKTYTMFGPEEWQRQLNACRESSVGRQQLGKASDDVHPKGREKIRTTLLRQSSTLRSVGIVPRVLLELFAAGEERREQGIELSVALSYLEVFGETFSDLLDATKARDATRENEVVRHRRALQGEMKVDVADFQTAVNMLEAAEERKRWGETRMNLRSSRAHTLLIIHLSQIHSGTETRSTLILADLGGSEKIAKSGAVESDVRLLEAININKGLFNLHRCARALAKNEDYIPFTGSRLTQLLEPAFNGRAKLHVLVTASDVKCHAPETLQSLRFLEDCSKLTYNDQGNGELGRASSIIKSLDDEIQRCEDQIRRKERWVNERTVVIDDFGERYAEGTTRSSGRNFSTSVCAQAGEEYDNASGR